LLSCRFYTVLLHTWIPGMQSLQAELHLEGAGLRIQAFSTLPLYVQLKGCAMVSLK